MEKWNIGRNKKGKSMYNLTVEAQEDVLDNLNMKTQVLESHIEKLEVESNDTKQQINDLNRELYELTKRVENLENRMKRMPKILYNDYADYDNL